VFTTPTVDAGDALHMDEEQQPTAPPQPPAWPEPPPHPGGFGWLPSATAQPPAAGGERRLGLTRGLLILLVGILAGGVGAYVVLRLQPEAGAAQIHVDNTPVRGGGSTQQVAQKLTPAVGTIIARQGTSSSSLGSGFVVAHGSGVSYLVTNNHVVSGSNDLHVVMPDGGLFTATLVGADRLDDLAVVSVPSDSLPLATFGDSSQLHVGQQVVAIGSPLGNQSSVTQGIISSRHRTISAGNGTGASSETLEDVLQTDASINPGNSGGPLADINARVVGVNVAIASSANNIGYAIPSNLAREVATELMQHKTVQHPFLGIGYLDAIDAVEAGRGFSGPGVLITTVSSGTPAAQAGFQANDILRAINGTDIDNGETLGGLIQDKHVGDKITCTVKRGSQILTLSATLEERPGNT
jgi:putative serine protease PepD